MSPNPVIALQPPSVARALFTRSRWLFAVLVLGAVLGHLAVPRLINDGKGPPPKLETIVPLSFGAWRIDASVMPLVPSPDQIALIGEIYDQTLARTYVNDRGERVMLSLAYGRNQSRRFQIHKPEVCYVGQGFRLTEVRFGALTLFEDRKSVV